ncbi:hypothetical protein ABT369_25645 [Dactylosporangium sp. NPDC000244]
MTEHRTAQFPATGPAHREWYKRAVSYEVLTQAWFRIAGPARRKEDAHVR